MTRSRIRGVVALALATLAAGCTQDFRPLGGESRARAGFEAIEYDLRIDGEDVGDAKVWSSSAPGEDAAGRLELGLRLRNDTASGMRLVLEETALELQTDDGRALDLERPGRVTGATRLGPHEVERLSLAFELPAGVAADEVASYALAWTIETDAGRVERSTTFVKAQLEPAARPSFLPYEHGVLGYPLEFGVRGLPGFGIGYTHGLGW